MLAKKLYYKVRYSDFAGDVRFVIGKVLLCFDPMLSQAWLRLTQ